MHRDPLIVERRHRTSWTRRDWLTRNTAASLALTLLRPSMIAPAVIMEAQAQTRRAAQAYRDDPAPYLAIAQHALDAARTAGASYADVRLTRTVRHGFLFFDYARIAMTDEEITGVGVRALVNGYWGFAACPWRETDAAVRVARQAVAQAQVNAKGPPRTVELGHVSAATGTWTTPIRVDPFRISLDEKMDLLGYWMQEAQQHGAMFPPMHGSHCAIDRQEQVLATSDGVCVAQTCYTSGGLFQVQQSDASVFGNAPVLALTGLTPAAVGWELFLDADIPGQLRIARETLRAQTEAAQRRGSKPGSVGRYTLVCDGATMAAVTARTLGVATQLDRALGYEANAGGTSFLDNPLEMLGHFRIAAPPVTVTANRSAPTQLATIKWDDEGVEPEECTLIHDGVLTDFQTTREQAAWLAPYYAKLGKPVRSHGYAAAENALAITMQHMPNLALLPSTQAIPLEDLVAEVKTGILVTHGDVQMDFQARTGLLTGQMQEITNGRLGKSLIGGAILFDSLDVWKHVTAVGGASTVMPIAVPPFGSGPMPEAISGRTGDTKGEPPQTTGYSVQAAAAVIPDQALILPARTA